MKKTIVIYHKSDFDGIFCREIAHKFLPDAELIGWDYGDPEPILTGHETLYMLDISIFGLMAHQDLIWIDHHKSAIDKYPATIPGYRIDGVAACRLTWQWFYQQQQMGQIVALPKKEGFIDRIVFEPFAVCLAGEYDIWCKNDARAELFQHGLRSEEILWAELLVPDPDDFVNPYVQKLLDQGKAIQYAKEGENAGIITSYGFNVEWEGLVFLACNHARFNSHLFTAGIKPSHDALLGFNWTGKHWRVSLYHAPGKEHHDLSQIAVKHGGGGHKGAAGMTVKELPFKLN